MESRTTAARHAAALFALFGLLACLSLLAPRQDRVALVGVAVADFSVAVLAMTLPWRKWPQRSTLVLGVPAFAVIVACNASGLLPPRALSTMFVLVFVWVGGHHRPWQSLWLAPLGMAAYVWAIVTNDHGIPLDPRAVLLTSVVCVLVAETLARGLARLRGSEAEMRFLVQHTTDLVTRIGIDGVIRYVSPSVQSVLGWRTEQVVGRRVSDFAHPDDPQPYELALVHPGKTVTVVRRLRKASGEWAWLETVAKQVTAPDGSAEVLTSARDVTRWREHEERLAHEATHDVLTGLPNRALLDRRLEQATLTRTSDPVLVAFVDLDGFKAINDRYGHHVGDQLLVEAGRRLSGMTREQDTVARYGGDEFVLVVQGLRDDAARDALVHRVEADLSRPYLIDELELHVGASVGVTVAPPGARSGDVLADADRRMYDVKASRRADVPAPRAAR